MLSTFAIANADSGRFRAVIGIGARLDLDSVIQQAISAHEGLASSLGISRMAQSSSNLSSVDLLAHLYGLRYGINLGGVAEDLTL